MSVQSQVVAEGAPQHITQRGNNRQDVFLLDQDRRSYIEALGAKSKQHGLNRRSGHLWQNLFCSCPLGVDATRIGPCLNRRESFGLGLTG